MMSADYHQSAKRHPSWDTFDRATRALMPLAFACAAGWFIGNGDWDTAWHFAVLWLLMLIFNVTQELLDAAKGKS